MEPPSKPGSVLAGKVDIYTRFANAHLVFRLPIPPGVNNLYFNLPKRGRAKSKRYRAWEAESDKWYMVQGLTHSHKLPGKYTVDILLPVTRGDPDGRIKPILDWMVSRDLTADDKHCTRITCKVDEGLESRRECWVAITRAQHD